MARTVRKPSSTGIYHVVARGINQQHIFEEDSDYERFLAILRTVKELSGCKVYAYCLMSNHYHLLIGEGIEPLSTSFRRLGARYVPWFNNKYDRVGHLFQDRYKSEPVQDDIYFQTAIRYIYQNPVKAGLCKKPSDYPWSSRRLLGMPSALVDQDLLSMIVSLDDLLKSADIAPGSDLLEAKDPGRKPRIAEDVAIALLAECSGANNAAAFQRLAKKDKQSAVTYLHGKGVSIRQTARITGLSKGIIESWRRRGGGKR